MLGGVVGGRSTCSSTGAVDLLAEIASAAKIQRPNKHPFGQSRDLSTVLQTYLRRRSYFLVDLDLLRTRTGSLFIQVEGCRFYAYIDLQHVRVDLVYL